MSKVGLFIEANQEFFNKQDLPYRIVSIESTARGREGEPHISDLRTPLFAKLTSEPHISGSEPHITGSDQGRDNPAGGM